MYYWMLPGSETDFQMCSSSRGLVLVCLSPSVLHKCVFPFSEWKWGCEGYGKESIGCKYNLLDTITRG